MQVEQCNRAVGTISVSDLWEASLKDVPSNSPVLSTALFVFLDLSVPWLLLPNFIEGILGYSEGFRMGCFSTLSDATTLENRSFRLTVLEALYVVTGAVANFGVGFLIDYTGFMLPYAIVAGLQVLNLGFIVLFIPKSVPPKIAVGESAQLMSCDHFKNVLQLFKGEITQGEPLLTC